MKQDSGKAADIKPCYAVNAVLGTDSKLDRLAERPMSIANSDHNRGANGDHERSPPFAPDYLLADILAGLETSDPRAAENLTQFNKRLNALCDKFAMGFKDILHPEDRPGERPLEDMVQKVADHIEASAGKSDDTPKAAQGSPIGTASWSTASIAGDPPLAPVITHLENRIADLADQIVDYESAQEDLRKLVQSEFGRLAQRIDVTKQASEAAAQRAQNQAVRLAQEELRKVAQSEFGRLAQRIDATKQASEAAAQRAQNQAIRLAKEELRKLAQSEFGRLAQRIDATKQASEAAAQRAQNQAIRLAQEELRKLVLGEFGQLGQRMDVLKHASEAAAQRAQTQAVQQAQKDLRDFEGRMQVLMKKNQMGAPESEIGRLSDEVESLGQRVDDLTVKSASERELGSLRVAMERLSARVAQGPDLKPLADLDRRLTEMTNKLEQRLANHVGGQIGAADLDKRIAAAVRQNQIPPPWTVIERKLTGISDRLANTEMELQHIATHEKWILQLYKGLEETLEWSRNVAEDAANRMASQLVREWSRKTDPARTSAEVGPVSAISASPALASSSHGRERSASSRMSLSTPWTAETSTIARRQGEGQDRV